MQSYSESRIFPLSYIRSMRVVARLVELLPDLVDKEPIRCHEIARLARRALERAEPHLTVMVYDGHYGPVEHSWLVIQDDDSTPCILDPYACSRLPQVQLIAPNLGHALPYRVGKPRDDIKSHAVLDLWSVYSVEIPDHR